MDTIEMSMGTAELFTMRYFIACTVHVESVGKCTILSCVERVANMGKGRSSFKILTGKPIGKASSKTWAQTGIQYLSEF